MGRQIDGQTNRQTDKQMNRQTDEQTNRRADKHMDRQTDGWLTVSKDSFFCRMTKTWSPNLIVFGTSSPFGSRTKLRPRNGDVPNFRSSRSSLVTLSLKSWVKSFSLLNYFVNLINLGKFGKT
jgi:hypothetical protein